MIGKQESAYVEINIRVCISNLSVENTRVRPAAINIVLK